MTFKRNCPICGRELEYEDYDEYEQAVALNTKCKRCKVFFDKMNRKISKEIKYESYFEKKLMENFFKIKEDKDGRIRKIHKNV